MDLENLDYLVVGAGIFGSVIAERIANELGQEVVVIDKRNHIGGNCYSATDTETGIEYHQYGTHIFHTSNETVWQYINRFTSFNTYRHQVLTTHKNKVYQMPINLETINSFYNLNLRPFEVNAFLEKEIHKDKPLQINSFEDKAIAMVGRPLYEAFLKGYTRKQWQIDPSLLPAELLNRLPFRNNYEESYFNNSYYQGIPLNGYTAVFSRLLQHKNIEVKLGLDYFDIKDRLDPATTVIFSGPADKLFDYRFGKLEWRSLRFDFEQLPYSDYQGTSVMNYADEDIPFTRIHEFKHLHPERKDAFQQSKTIISTEYSIAGSAESPYYPVNTPANSQLIKLYTDLAGQNKKLVIGGRMGEYKYFDMDKTIESALHVFEEKIKTPWKQKN